MFSLPGRPFFYTKPQPTFIMLIKQSHLLTNSEREAFTDDPPYTQADIDEGRALFFVLNGQGEMEVFRATGFKSGPKPGAVKYFVASWVPEKNVWLDRRLGRSFDDSTPHSEAKVIARHMAVLRLKVLKAHEDLKNANEALQRGRGIKPFLDVEILAALPVASPSRRDHHGNV